jgi:hypothetical protein
MPDDPAGARQHGGRSLATVGMAMAPSWKRRKGRQHEAQVKGIPIPGFRIDKKTGKPVRDMKRLSVSDRLKQQSKNSKRVRVARRSPTPWAR